MNLFAEYLNLAHRLAGMDSKLAQILNNQVRQETRIMSALNDVETAEARILKDEAALLELAAQQAASNRDLAAQVAALQAQIANGGTVTDADLAPIAAALNAGADQIEAALPAPAAPPPPPSDVDTPNGTPAA